MKAKYKSRGVKAYAPQAPSGVNRCRLDRSAPLEAERRGDAIRP